MKYRHYETPMDWLKEKGKDSDIFVIWIPPDTVITGVFAVIDTAGLVREQGDTMADEWESYIIELHWRPFSDIEALDSDDPILTTARINAES